MNSAGGRWNHCRLWLFLYFHLFSQLLPQTTVHVYFEAAAVIVALDFTGRYLEAKAKGKTSEAIQYLIGLQPKTARVQQNGSLG